jgi:glycosyltransferase involved in cell wall biosynthesis
MSDVDSFASQTAKKKSILHIIETIGKGGGAEILLANTVTNLPDYNNVVVTLYPYHDEYDLGNIPVYCLNLRSTWGFLKSIYILKGIIKKHEVKLIHAHLFRSALLAKLAKPKDVKLVVSLHTILSIEIFRNKPWYWLEKMLKQRQDAIIAVSNFVLKDYLSKIRFDGKKFVLYNFIPESFFSREGVAYQQRNGELKCVAVGHFKPTKNHFYLLRSFNGLANENITLDLYGEGPNERQIVEFIETNKLKNVNVVGLFDNISDVLKKYDIFISASLYEGFGIALLEAMASGLVCIVSDIPVHREVAADSCLFFDLKEPGSLNAVLSQIIIGKLDISAYSEKARERAYKISNQENYFQNLKKIYEEIIVE